MIYFDNNMTEAVCGDCGARVNRTRANPYPEPKHKKVCKATAKHRTKKKR